MMKIIKEWGPTVLITAIIVFAISFFVRIVYVDGPSMQPNLEDKQMVLAFRQAKISRGSVVVFDATKEDPGIRKGQKYYVKRVIGIAGDTVRSEDGKLYVNDKLVNQSYISENERNTGTMNWNLEILQGDNSPAKSINADTGKAVKWEDSYSTTVPKGQYFVLGDHRSVSEDSRYFGWISKDHILGVVYSFPWSARNAQVNNEWTNFFAK